MPYKNIAQHEIASSEPYRKTEWKQLVSVAFIALLIAFARMPDRLIHGFLWAEDGQIFLQQAYGLGVRSIVTPYAGYLHIIPRLIAFSFSLFPGPEHSPRPFAWASTLVLCATCAYLFSFARPRMPAPAAWIFALTPILVPHNGEVWLTITNIQWVIAPALLVLLWETVYVSAGWARTIAVILLTLTGPFGLLYSPLVVIGLILARRFPRAIAAYFSAVAIQFICTLINQRGNVAPGEAKHTLLDYLHFPWKDQFLHHFALDYLTPVNWANRLGTHWEIVAIACAAVLALCFVLAGNRLICCALAALAVGLWSIGVLRTGVWSFDLTWYGSGARYFFVPLIFMTWALLLSITTTPYPTVKYIASFFLVMVAINSASLFKSPIWPRPHIVYESGHPAALTIAPSDQWNIPLH